MSSMEMVISSDLVRARAEITALNQSLAAARTEIATVDNRVQWVSSQVANTGAVKSVQRGIVSLAPFANGGPLPELIVNINPVTMDRAVLHLVGAPSWVAGGNCNYINAHLLNSSQIRFEWGMLFQISGINCRISWELLEYK